MLNFNLQNVPVEFDLILLLFLSGLRLSPVSALGHDLCRFSPCGFSAKLFVLIKRVPLEISASEYILSSDFSPRC